MKITAPTSLASEVDPDRKKALAAREPFEMVLDTVDGTSFYVEPGYVYDGQVLREDGTSYRERGVTVVRVDTELDAVYAKYEA